MREWEIAAIEFALAILVYRAGFPSLVGILVALGIINGIVFILKEVTT